MSGLCLDSYIKLDREVILSPNLCDRFGEQDLLRIGEWCGDSYVRDRASRRRWYKRTEGALELAMQVQKAKTFPWAGCSNIIFPLVTIAAMQFHARAYPTIVNGKDVVKCRVIGPDPEGIASARADRISSHMSWQLTEQDEAWEEETDRSLLNVAIVGCGFKKSYYDGSKQHNVSTYVHAKDLVFDYWAKSIETAKTKTHLVPFYRNEIYSRVKSGVFRDVLEESWYVADATVVGDESEVEEDDRDGLDRPQSDHDTPFTLCEQHCWLDLDGDGYEEPYIVTFEESNRAVVRIVTRFDREEDIERNARGDIIQINAWEYFTKVPFIPAPDGSCMDIGFGVLLGPLNESVDAAINQLFDAGTLSNTAGGFLGRGAKIRGGIYEFAPFSWNRVDSTGDDLRKNIMPLPVREPSDVMFKLLGLIIDYSNRISGTTDISVGENVGQNTPAETSRTMNENGQKIYTAIYKRIWLSFKKEFRKLYQLNSVYLPMSTRFGTEQATIGREDYAGPASGVVPVADPTIVSEAQRYNRAITVKQMAMGNPAYDADSVEVEVLRALGIQDIEKLYKGVANAPPPPPDVKLQIQQLKNEVEMARLQAASQQFIIKIQQDQALNQAKIAELQAKTFKLQQEGESVPGKQRIEAFRAEMEWRRTQDEQLSSQIKSLMELGKNEFEARTGGAGPVPLLEGPPSNAGGLPTPASADQGAGGAMAGGLF